MAHYSESRLSQNLKLILYILGLWSKPLKQPLYQLYSYTIHFVISFIYCLCLSINLLMKIDDVEHFTESLYPTLTVLAYLFKVINYYCYDDNIIECLAKLLTIQQTCRSNENIFRRKLEYLNKLTIFFYCAANCTIFAGAFKTFLATDVELPIPSWYPLDWQHNRTDFWIVFSHNLIGAFIVGNLNLAMDCYAYYLMGIVTSQIEMLHVNIEELGTNIDDIGEVTHLDKRKLKNNVLSLNLCMTEHQQIMDLVSDIERYFSMQFFAQICLSGATLSCGIYQLNTVSPTENFFKFAYSLAFMMTITMQTFLYTYYGNGVLVASDSLSNALYSSKWYAMLPVFRRNSIIFMERLKRRYEILAGKLFAVNLELFTKIMDIAYRLYIFLKGVS